MSEDHRFGSLNTGDADDISGTIDSMPPLGLGPLDAEHGVVLKDWSAQDFSNIYVRFRPHLISHARKFLREESKAEEVVQDAFLYLMTALPELDSELGVLRFLKWKTKMLCLDSLRSSTSGLNANLVPILHDVADESQLEASLERADDAAIIGLALAKLNPRYREALIATLYEEKSHEEVARQMGVGQNAFRQLLFRARASFKLALVGEAEIEGKSITQILAVAARRAATERTAIVLALLSLASFSALPLLDAVSRDFEDTRASSVSGQAGPLIPLLEGNLGVSSLVESNQISPDGPTEVGNAQSQGTSLEMSGDYSFEEEEKTLVVASLPVEDEIVMEADLSREAFNASLNESMVTSIAETGFELSRDSSGNFTATSESGLRAFFSIDLTSENVVQFLVVEFESDGQVWIAVPSQTLSVVDHIDSETLVSFAATDFLVGDFSGSYDFVSTTDSVFSRSGIKLDLSINSFGFVTSSEVHFLPNT